MGSSKMSEVGRTSKPEIKRRDSAEATGASIHRAARQNERTAAEQVGL